MKEIPLTQGKVALVDDEDYARLIAMGNWQYSCRGYVTIVRPINRNGRKIRTTIFMHREILGSCGSLEIDHINLDKCDNRKKNLRFCTSQENKRNRRMPKNNSTGFKGVVYEKDRDKFKAHIRACIGKKITIGRFLTAIEAARAYNEAAIKYHGEFAKLNPI